MKKEFLAYVRSFYGRGGLYEEFFATNPPTAADFRKAVDDLLRLREKQGIPFEGDSFDRETLRDILLVRTGIVQRGQTEFQTHIDTPHFG